MDWKFNPPPAKAGQPILPEHIQAILEVRDRIPTQAAPPLALSGNVLYLDDRPGFWIKVTGAASGTAYPWTEQLPATGGTWTTGYQSGTTSSDPAYEVNGSTSVPTNKIVWAYRDLVTNEVRFVYSAC